MSWPLPLNNPMELIALRIAVKPFLMILALRAFEVCRPCLLTPFVFDTLSNAGFDFHDKYELEGFIRGMD